MANPRYHDDPEWYERPGETVHLHVDANPGNHVVPALPWLEPGYRGSMADRTAAQRDWQGAVIGFARVMGKACAVCATAWDLEPTGLCSFCARAQQRDETAKARANQPQPSRARISIREGWEVWATSHQPSDAEQLETGHVREYETRVG